MRRADRADAFLMGSVSAILIAFSIQARGSVLMARADVRQDIIQNAATGKDDSLHIPAVIAVGIAFGALNLAPVCLRCTRSRGIAMLIGWMSLS